jgi:hypothetical protein
MQNIYLNKYFGINQNKEAAKQKCPPAINLWRALCGAYWDRTSDLLPVKQAL